MTLNHSNIKSFVNFAEKLIKKSEKIILENHKKTITIKYKKDSSPVTKIDKLIEITFRNEIKKNTLVMVSMVKNLKIQN